MHTLDLNVTTDVETIFADREPWFSPRMNRTGYCTFNFTYSEIQQLSVRQRLPTARNTNYDGLFSVPSLTDILKLVNDWNINILPHFVNVSAEREFGRPSPIELHYSGVYAELKHTSWLREEANIDIVDLLYQHLEVNIDLWDILIPCYDGMKYNEYRTPGLVIQSFEAPTLSTLHTRWRQTFNASVGNERPTPPLVLLVDKYDCFEQVFWEDITDKYRSFLDGIGCEKSCVRERGDVTVVKANELGLSIHAWTSRPERNELLGGTSNLIEEIERLFCDIGVSAVFTESVHGAVMVAKRGCPSGSSAQGNTSERSSSPENCSTNDTSESNVYLGLIAFATGIVVSAMAAIMLLGRRNGHRKKRTLRVAVYDEDDLELT